MDIPNILILGGAGFIGSSLVKTYCNNGYKVTVLDAFYDFTGANIANLTNYLDKIQLIDKPIQDCRNLKEILLDKSVIVDCMGWTAHHEAIENPEQDVHCNVMSHLQLIKALKNSPGKQVVYLGSRGQYGNINTDIIYENMPMLPEDVQGINKVSAENFYRVYSKFYDFDVLSIRIPNCFGPGQLTKGDIGLVGSFIKDSLSGKQIKVYGKDRKRSLLFVRDLAEIIFILTEKIKKGFDVININGNTITISDLAQKICNLTLKGEAVIKAMPDKISKMDMGGAKLSEDNLRSYIPNYQYTNIESALFETINYFKNKI